MTAPLKQVGRWFRGAFASPRCPLCNGTGTDRVYDFIKGEALKAALVASDSPARPSSAWCDSHGCPSGIPSLEPEYEFQHAAEAYPGFAAKAPKNAPDADEEHRRCKHCRSLLPSEFYETTPDYQFPLTVAGTAVAGKTTWLMRMFTPPDNDVFEVVGNCPGLRKRAYPYAEPYSLSLLKKGFRTAIPYTLLGCTIQWRNEVYGVRVLDIRGESFEGPLLQDTIRKIRRLASGSDGRAALLMVERFKHPQAAQASFAGSIVSAYHTILSELISQDVQVWTPIVWTWLDAAEYTGTEITRRWLSSVDPTLERWAATACEKPIEKSSFAELTALARRTGDAQAWALSGAAQRIAGMDGAKYRENAAGLGLPEFEDFPAHSAEYYTPEFVEDLVAILFRLQVLYSVKAMTETAPDGLISPKLAYLERCGRSFVWACIELARAAYLLWASPSGRMAEYVRSESTMVLPCGLVRWQDREVPVWSDAMLVFILAKLRDSGGAT